MWKKRIIFLALALCAVLVLTGCQQKETFPTSREQAEQVAAEAGQVQEDTQNIFGETPVPVPVDFDDGSYDPTAEEGGGQEAVNDSNAFAYDFIIRNGLLKEYTAHKEKSIEARMPRMPHKEKEVEAYKGIERE